MSWKTRGIRPKRPLEVVLDGEIYRGWVSAIFKSYIRRAEFSGRRLPVGWEDRVWEQLQSQYPHYIIHEADPGPPPVQVSVIAIRNFLKFVINRGLNRSVVAQETAEARAALCSRCPIAGSISGCSACKAAAKALVGVPKTGMIPKDKSGCTACGCYTDVKIWIPAKDLQEEVERHDWWEHCWMRQLDQEIALTQD